jgi:DNA polymerase III subunit alpha
MPFTHLHTHSHFSLLEGVAAPAALAERAAQFKMPALALTDHNALYGAVPFYQACRAAGVQPILGLELDTDEGDRLVLLARDFDGYRRLCRLSSAVQLSRPSGGRRAGAPLDLLRSEAGGLIVLSGGKRGLITNLVRLGKINRASRLVGAYASMFGADNFFVELVIHDPDDAATVFDLVRLADELGVPTVAANDTLGVTPEDAPAADLLDAIRTRTTLAAPHPDKAAHPDRYLKSPAQMERLFGDYPQALANTRFIARRCDVELPLGPLRFPGFSLPSGETAFSQLWKTAFAGATRLYRPLTAAVTARLQRELAVIEEQGFAPYFLIVHDIVRWTRRQGIPVLGRGSAGDSLVAYVLGITQVDPLAHGLYFERFLNPERPAPPDIDLDLCWRRRDEVLTYVYDTYGADHVAMIGTHISFKLRSAWRDVAKAHGVPPDGVAALAGRPWGYNLDEAQADVEDPGAATPAAPEDADPAWGPTYPPEAETGVDEPPGPDLPALDPALLAGCQTLDGRPRHLGIHCGGIVIAPFPITDEVPLQRATKGIAVTQYEMDAIADLGLVKIDLLGSRALSALSATAARARVNGQPLELDHIPFDDAATYAVLSAGETLGCFQLESPGMRALLKAMQPRRLDDIIAAVSLFRPGPLEGGLKDTFLKRLREGAQPPYLHPRMEDVLAETHGVILYQEQFLRLVHELAGFSLGHAERLRKLLNKAPDPEERAQLRAAFIAGAIGNDIAQPLAEEIWEVLAGYTGFGFCKAHAASYAVVAYRMAYCKAHYPAELLAAVLDNQAGFYPALVYVEEARRLRLQLLGPDVNRSAAGTMARGRALRLGLNAVKGLRRDTVSAVIAARREGGTFVSLRDLLTRAPMSKPEISALIGVGALDRIAGERSRPELLWQARLWLPVLERARARGAGGDQTRLPLLEPLPDLPAAMPPLRPYSEAERLDLEHDALGFTFSASPLTPYRDLLARYRAVPTGELIAHAGESIVVGGIPVVVRRHLTVKGEWMLFLTLQDLTDLIEVVVMPDSYQAALPALVAGGPVVVRGRVEVAIHGGVVFHADRMRPLGAPGAGEAPPAPEAPAAELIRVPVDGA